MSQSDNQSLIVIIPIEIENAIDDSISGPVDAIIVIKQIFHELPDLHRKIRSRRTFRCFRNALPIYRGLIDWCGVGFDYVEHHGHLHILRVRDDIAADTADAIIDQSTDSARYVNESDCGGGVSIIS